MPRTVGAKAASLITELGADVVRQAGRRPRRRRYDASNLPPPARAPAASTNGDAAAFALRRTAATTLSPRALGTSTPTFELLQVVELGDLYALLHDHPARGVEARAEITVGARR
ncbi:MAG: hypothetical protein U5L03_05195 [Burkholderiaceae bacterium]|nr:hypothetical protein [Burkholderiaceae bacterium]